MEEQYYSTTLHPNHDALEKKPLPEITLRPFDPSDLDAFMTWASDERVTLFQRRGPFTNKEDALNYITHHIVPHPWYRAICVTNRPVGSISIKPMSGDDRCRAAIGYRLAYEYWGKGIASVAVKKVVETVFEEWPHLERVEGVVDVENKGSQRVLEKAGFKREGVLRRYMVLKGETRDVVMYSFIREDHFIV